MVLESKFDIKQFLIQQKEYPITWLVITLSFIPFILISMGGINTVSMWFIPSTINIGNFWQTVTPTFIHYTLLHLLSNITIWWLLATKIEHNSQRSLILFFVVSAVFSNVCQWLVMGSEFGGLSGVNYALLGYLVVSDKLTNFKRYNVDPVLVILLLILIPLGFTGLVGKYANYAHLGGLMIGCILAVLNLYMFNKNK